MTSKKAVQDVEGRETDRAVSPVIGVILMVAITVILAAVIGVFVLGLGDELGDGAAPTATIGFGDGTSEYNLTIEHRSGDTITLSDSEVTLLIEGQPANVTAWDVNNGDEVQLSAGETARVTLGEDESEGQHDVQLRHEPSNSIIATGTVHVTEGE